MTEPFAELNAALADHYIIDRDRGGMALVYLARGVSRVALDLNGFIVLIDNLLILP